jgi:hypothetical protein
VTLHLEHAIDLAHRTQVPLVVVCSQAARGHEVIDLAAWANIEAHAIDLTGANSLSIPSA